MWTKEVLRASLPECVLVTDGDRRENDGVVVVDFDVDSYRPRQEVRHTADDLKAKEGATAEEERQPEEPGVVIAHVTYSTKSFLSIAQYYRMM